ncbi:NAD-dependent epimerase/dehydratase family protein [Streptomyces sp. NPDC026589]|uniref:NAD-dependent epimerase/dehydratase family protein n=1 Tax=Streptomyces sp. NPDC026589 TaxID=3155609 RepID=UPI0033CB9EE8
MIPAPEAAETVVVTGGAGFLGSHLCDRLLVAGWRVVCVDNFSTGLPENLVQARAYDTFGLHVHDVCEPFDIPGPVSAVMHLASPASPRDYGRLTLETLRAGSLGVFHALELARRKGARAVFTSSSEVYGDPLVHPQTEDYRGNVNPVGPRAVYDEAKRFGETACLTYRERYAVDTAIVRLFNTYGPRMREDDGRMVPTFVRQALTGDALTVFGRGDQTRSLCYVDDTVQALLEMMRSGHPGPVNIGNPEELSVRATALLIRELTGTRSPVRELPAMPEDPRLRCPDIALAREVLGWAPRIGVRDGLLRTIGWYREQQADERGIRAAQIL